MQFNARRFACFPAMSAVREFLAIVSVECVQKGSLSAAPPEWLDAVAALCTRQEIGTVEVLAQAKATDFERDGEATTGKKAFLADCIAAAQKLRPSANASSEACCRAWRASAA